MFQVFNDISYNLIEKVSILDIIGKLVNIKESEIIYYMGINLYLVIIHL